MTTLNDIIISYEQDNNVTVDMLTQEEICDKYKIDINEIKNFVENYNGQTLPVELMVITQADNSYKIYHAKNPNNI